MKAVIGIRRLFGHRDACLYLIGQCLSVTGDGALWLAMAIWAKILTRSNSAAGFTFVAFIAGMLSAPLSGLLADRVRRRPLLIWANVGSAVLVCLLLLAQHRSELWLIYAVMFGYGVLNSMIMVAQTAFLVTLVPDDLLPEANTDRSRESWNSEFLAGMRHIGRTPALRRLLIAGVVGLLHWAYSRSSRSP